MGRAPTVPNSPNGDSHNAVDFPNISGPFLRYPHHQHHKTSHLKIPAGQGFSPLPRSVFRHDRLISFARGRVVFLEPLAGLGKALLDGCEAVVGEVRAELGVAGGLLELPVRFVGVELG